MKALPLLLLAGCASIPPDGPEQRIDAPRAPMDGGRARRVVATSLQRGFDGLYQKSVIQNLRVNRKRAAFVYAGDDAWDCVMTFDAVERWSLRKTGYGEWRVLAHGKPLVPSSLTRKTFTGMAHGAEDFALPDFPREEDARLFIDAVLTLKRPDVEEADFAAFCARVKEPRPAMSEEVRTFKALAEDAFKQKDFGAALEAYLEALGKYPLWPEGHYNAALLAAEVEDFELAAKHMRRYIALAPEAKDINAAQEKYLLWRHKAKP